MQALARVENEDPRVNPNPWASVVCLIVSYGGAQDDDLFEYPPEGSFKQIKYKDFFHILSAHI